MMHFLQSFFNQNKYLLSSDFPDDEVQCLYYNTKEYIYTIFYNNKLNIHSINEPTTIETRGGEAITYYYWYNDGKLHRADGAACYSSYISYWYRHGKLHRADGAAVIDCSQGDTKLEYYYDGLRHRSDGPAIDYTILSKYATLVYYYYGQYCTEEEFNDAQWRQRQELIYYES